jgi:hypothetical protein
MRLFKDPFVKAMLVVAGAFMLGIAIGFGVSWRFL